MFIFQLFNLHGLRSLARRGGDTELWVQLICSPETWNYPNTQKIKIEKLGQNNLLIISCTQKIIVASVAPPLINDLVIHKIF